MKRTVDIRVDAVTTARVPLFPVAHLTDPSVPGRPVVLGVHDFFNEQEARDFAKEQSECYPAPQRFVVYTPQFQYVAGYQCGEEMSAFVVVN